MGFCLPNKMDCQVLLAQGAIGIHITSKEMSRWVGDILISFLAPWIPLSWNHCIWSISTWDELISFPTVDICISLICFDAKCWFPVPRLRNRKARSTGFGQNWKTHNPKMRIFRWISVTKAHKNFNILCVRRSLTRSSKRCLAAMPRETSMLERWTSSEKNLREYRWKYSKLDLFYI